MANHHISNMASRAIIELRILMRCASSWLAPRGTRALLDEKTGERAFKLHPGFFAKAGELGVELLVQFGLDFADRGDGGKIAFGHRMRIGGGGEPPQPLLS